MMVPIGGVSYLTFGGALPGATQSPGRTGARATLKPTNPAPLVVPQGNRMAKHVKRAQNSSAAGQVSPHPFIPPEGRISFRERYVVKSGLDMTQWSTIISGMGPKLNSSSRANVFCSSLNNGHQDHSLVPIGRLVAFDHRSGSFVFLKTGILACE
jgi:hypothetical protein